ncbi:MAG: magnesium/cobalt transporter CorA [Phycisphaerales bacterium]|nr:magnesium/cobalt transporter CorA [Phycisphaerales bacterium]
MIRAFIKFGDDKTSTDSSADSLRSALRDPKAVLWLDMQQPTEKEYALLDEVFGFHPLAIEDSIKYSQRPKIESYDHIGDVNRQGYFYMVVHGPDVKEHRKRIQTMEIDLFMSSRYLVTIHDDELKHLDELAQKAAADTPVVLDAGIDMLLYNILDHLVDYYEPILEYLQESIDDLEEEAMANPTPQVLHAISSKKRELLNLRRIVGPQREVIAQLTRGEVPFIRESTRTYLRDVQDHLIRVVEMVELYRDLIMGARDIYLSSISNHLNQIMKTLTIISVVALPFTVVTSFFGMNFESIPGLHSPIAFWAVVVVMIIAMTIMLYLFRKKRWF